MNEWMKLSNILSNWRKWGWKYQRTTRVLSELKYLLCKGWNKINLLFFRPLFILFEKKKTKTMDKFSNKRHQIKVTYNTNENRNVICLKFKLINEKKKNIMKNVPNLSFFWIFDFLIFLRKSFHRYIARFAVCSQM